MVPDDNVHLIHTPPLFGTRGILILDIAIASYSTTHFYIIFLYFILQVKTWQETSQGSPAPYQTASNVGNCNLSILASSNTREGGYVKLLAVGPTEANTGLFHSSFFVFLFLTRMPLTFSKPLPHGADRLHTPPMPQRPSGIFIKMLNIWDGQGFGLAQAIQEMKPKVFDVMILTKRKIYTMAYCRNRLGYKVS